MLAGAPNAVVPRVQGEVSICTLLPTQCFLKACHDSSPLSPTTREAVLRANSRANLGCKRKGAPSCCSAAQPFAKGDRSSTDRSNFGQKSDGSYNPCDVSLTETPMARPACQKSLPSGAALLNECPGVLIYACIPWCLEPKRADCMQMRMHSCPRLCICKMMDKAPNLCARLRRQDLMLLPSPFRHQVREPRI